MTDLITVNESIASECCTPSVWRARGRWSFSGTHRPESRCGPTRAPITSVGLRRESQHVLPHRPVPRGIPARPWTRDPRRSHARGDGSFAGGTLVYMGFGPLTNALTLLAAFQHPRFMGRLHVLPGVARKTTSSGGSPRPTYRRCPTNLATLNEHYSSPSKVRKASRSGHPSSGATSPSADASSSTTPTARWARGATPPMRVTWLPISLADVLDLTARSG